MATRRVEMAVPFPTRWAAWARKRLSTAAHRAEHASRIQAPATPLGPLAAPQRLNDHTSMYNNDTVVFFWQQTTPQGMQNFGETWVKENGQWKCAESHQSLGVPPAPGGGGAGGRDGGRGRGN